MNLPPAPSSDLDTRLRVAIISWQGHGERAAAIARSIDACPGVDCQVIYSNAAEQLESGAGHWIQMPNSAFFGAKFARALEGLGPRPLLIIQADASHRDWPALLRRCQALLSQRPALGMWSPRIDYTPWSAARVDIRQADEGLVHVAHTDGIVLALAADVVRRLQALDYRHNNLGWGIDWIAICHCLSTGLEVLRDDTLLVRHPRSRGYDERQATQQWLAFMQQMSPREQLMFELLKRYTAEKRKGPLERLRASIRRRITRWQAHH